MMYKSLVIVSLAAFILLGDITSAMETETILKSVSEKEKESKITLEDEPSVCKDISSNEGHQIILNKVNEIMDGGHFSHDVDCPKIDDLVGDKIQYYCPCLTNEDEHVGHPVIIAIGRYKELCVDTGILHKERRLQDIGSESFDDERKLPAC